MMGTRSVFSVIDLKIQGIGNSYPINQAANAPSITIKMFSTFPRRIARYELLY